MCVDSGDSTALLRLVAGDSTSISSNNSSSASVASPALSPSEQLVWLHCRALVTTRLKDIKDLKGIFSTDHRMINKTSRAILKPSTFTNTTDLRCGNMLRAQNSTGLLALDTNTTNSAQQKPQSKLLLDGSPYEMNAWMFHGIRNEWAVTTTHTNWFLGTFVVLMVLQTYVLARLLWRTTPWGPRPGAARRAAAANQASITP